MSGDVALHCAACDAPLLEDDRFCESCGTAVAGTGVPAGIGCRACGAPAGAVGADGYCTVCGVRERPPGAELDLALAAAVSEQGRTHRRNEDAFDLERVGEREFAAVVCDGISTALSGDLAARAAAEAATAVLAEALRDPTGDAPLVDATRAAVRAAHDAVRGVPWTTRSDLALPSCTIVSAVWDGDVIVVGWLGDSRAYWLAAGDARQVTVDDSWATEQVTEGLLTHEEAIADRRAHAITRWVGADAPDDAPQIEIFRPGGPGRLILCSDGLWNYAPEPQDLASLLEELAAGAAPVAVARHLAGAAMERGGRDDVTVAVIDVQPERSIAP